MVLGITWEIIRNANSQDPPQIQESATLGVRLRSSSLKNSEGRVLRPAGLEHLAIGMD